MKGYTATRADGEAIHYADPKRWWWFLSVLYPLQPLLGIGLHWLTGWEGWLLLTVVLNFGLGPILDWLLGEDRHNPPEEVLIQLDQDRYYRYLTYAAVPMHYLSLLAVAWYATSRDLSTFGFVSLAIVAGLTAGLAINTGHELGHKNSKVERFLARLALALPAYGHFTIEHNRGHHKNVSTPVDPASARMGESIYRFALREIPGAFAEAWSIEKERLTARGKSAWHPSNRILQANALSLALVIGLTLAFGWAMLPFMLIHNLFAYWQLTSANYVEHYGLLRTSDENGRIERCQPHHSWNSNHIFSNLVLFHLERHSDHHTHPLRRYQALRHYDDLPSLPSGYFGAYLLAYIPPLWFRVMDRRLLALAHVGGSLDKVNMDPRARDTLTRRYGHMATV